MISPTAAARRIRRLWRPEDTADALSWLRAMRRSVIRSDISHLAVSEWAEKKRILPEGLTPRPGPFSWSVAPYMREIADCLSATSSVSEVVVMKGAQVCGTVAVLENFIGYVIDCEPGPTMMVSADAGVAEASVELRVDRMIESAGLSGKIFAQAQKKHGKKTGDTAAKKEFPGGFLLAVGPRSGSKLRNFSVRYLLFDELDAYPQQVGGGALDSKTASEGDPITLAKRRTDAFEAIRKILYISTPLIKQTSRIEPLYLEGDQRKYFVPCKKCGELQSLEWKNIKYEKDESGKLIWSSVRYECAHCGAAWKNEDKAYFLPRGEWRPTATPQRPGLRSYHVPALLSPVGFRSWESIAQEWVDAQGDLNRLRAFVNTVLGESYEERGEAPDYQRVMLRREERPDYLPEILVMHPDGSHEWREAVVPDGARVLTLAADVQRDRIECELVAWGRDMESWSVGYHELTGDTSDLDAAPWRLLTEIIERPTHGGIPLAFALIDSGDQAPTVYAYCDRYERGVIPLKGGYRDTGRHAFAIRDITGHACKRVDVDESYLKQLFYSQALKGPADRLRDGEAVPDGYCHFPAEYDRRHFEKLFAEDLIIETTRYGRPVFHWKRRGRNEALDCRAYNLAALHVLANAATATTEDAPGYVDWPAYWDMLDNSVNA